MNRIMFCSAPCHLAMLVSLLCITLSASAQNLTSTAQIDSWFLGFCPPGSGGAPDDYDLGTTSASASYDDGCIIGTADVLSAYGRLRAAASAELLCAEPCMLSTAAGKFVDSLMVLGAAGGGEVRYTFAVNGSGNGGSTDLKVTQNGLVILDSSKSGVLVTDWASISFGQSYTLDVNFVAKANTVGPLVTIDYLTGTDSGATLIGLEVRQNGRLLSDFAWSGLSGATYVDLLGNTLPGWTPPPPPRLYVNALAAGAEDGTSWADAFTRLQDAMEVSKLAFGQFPIEIWVAGNKGAEYRPDQGFAVVEGNRSEQFVLRNELAFYGGFAGGETELEQRDIAANPTIMSGDLLGNDDTSDPFDLGLTADNSIHVVTAFDVDASAVIDGFIIESGNANGDSNGFRGGGMFLSEASPTIANCTFRWNSAGPFDCGNPPVPYCNEGYGGGLGVAVWGTGQFLDASSPTLTNCTFQGNRAKNRGGGLYHIGSSTPGSFNSIVMSECKFVDNEAVNSHGGAFYTSTVESLTCIDCDFLGNSSIGGGGGAYFAFGAVQLGGCVFEDNHTSVGTSSGGGAIIANASLLIDGCAFVSNSCPSGGGGLLMSSSSGTITNSLFANNQAQQGGGVRVIHSPGGHTETVNCTLSANDAGSGSGIYFSGGTAIVSNSILWENSSEEIVAIESGLSVGYSDIQGGWPGEGNIDADPMFVNPGTGDFHLASGSPGIDAASNESVPEGTVTDLDGNARFVDDPATADTGVGRAPIVDMGAYEFQFDCADADLNCDGLVGPADLAELLAQWGACPECLADIAPGGGDGVVGPADLAELLAHWG